MASIYKRSYWAVVNGKRVKRKCRNYTIELKDGRKVRGYTDKATTEQKAAALERAIERGEEGLIDTYAEHKNRAVADHLKDYLGELRAAGRDDKYVENIDKRLSKLRAECRWGVLADIEPNSFTHWREANLGKLNGKTLNQYRDMACAFCRWAVRLGRLPKDPLSCVGKVEAESKRQRRSYSIEEIYRLLTTAPAEHRIVYLTALATGLRRQELADLCWGDVRLNAPTPFLKLRAKKTKARRADVIALKAEAAEELRKWRGEDREDTERVFAVPSLAIFKHDLAAARIPYIDESGRYADFHSLRKTLNTMLLLTGVPDAVGMKQIRLTDRKLYDHTYADKEVFNMAAAVEKLPKLLPDAHSTGDTARATGTDGTPLVGTLVGTSTSERQGAAASGTNPQSTGGSYLSASQGEGHGAALGGSDRQNGGGTERVGIEPTSARGAGRRRF